MPSTVLCAVTLLACALTFGAAQMSCKGRCGAEYYRGYICQCDYNCLSYGECCKDYESQCTTKNSCRGRCGENFKRGRLCSCDPDCMKYKQCCPDYKINCDAEEEISGAASATAPGKTSSCHNVNNNKPKEPTLNEAIEQPSTFSEGNDADDNLIPLVSPTSYPPDDPSDDTYSQNPAGGLEDPQASPIPEGTSGYGSTTADLQDQVSAEPTLDPDAAGFSAETVTVFSQTETSPSDNEPTQADDSPVTLYMASGEAPTEATDASDPLSPTAADHVSTQPSPTSAPQSGVSPADSTPELEAKVQPDGDVFPEATEASSDKPEVTTPNTATSVSTGVSQDNMVQEMSQATSIPASSTPDLAPVPHATTEPNPEPDHTESNLEDATSGPPSVLSDPQDPSTDVSPEGDMSELEALTTLIPSSDDTKDDFSPPVTPDLSKPQPSEPTSKPQDKPSPTKPTQAKPTSKPEAKPVDTAQTLNIDDTRDYQADDSNDTNLCSGRPVSAVTTLRNGTITVFRGHYFWILDRNRVPSPARGITQVWGVPSPIDTVFTRCNCQGKTYIFKGPQYWRFENDVLDPGYPKVIETGFDGLRGHITAALSVPQYRNRRESVYFFKRGGLVQNYSYQFGTSPTCGRKPQYPIYTARNRIARQAVSLLNPAVNIRTSWRGFPSTITAAVSVPNNREPEGYKYYVFSRSKSYNVRMDGERPVIAATAANASPQSSNFFKCSKKV